MISYSPRLYSISFSMHFPYFTHFRTIFVVLFISRYFYEVTTRPRNVFQSWLSIFFFILRLFWGLNFFSISFGFITFGLLSWIVMLGLPITVSWIGVITTLFRIVTLLFFFLDSILYFFSSLCFINYFFASTLKNNQINFRIN